MNRERAINVLNNAGIKAEATEVNKNGVLVEGILIGDGSVRGTVYKDFYESVQADDDLVNKVNDNVLKGMPKFDASTLMTKDYILQNALLCIGKGVREGAVQRPFIDMVRYIRIEVNDEIIGKGSFILYNKHLDAIGITEDEIFKAALDKAKKDIMVMPIGEMIGMSIPTSNPPMIVVSNESCNYGASAMLNTDALDKIANDNNVKELVIIPSSIHEVILVPYDADRIDLNVLKQMVSEVNTTSVAPEEVLSNNVYFYDTETKGYSVFEA